ncbi:MAG TPA: dicarboxylate/amino acid:cation symporter [Mucilaginibacter sp.]|nr:dicarboxylate/amino acid:cation symporter [Mucilaginibacter sp.]
MQKNNLTLYIFIALVLGIITGYLYNVLAISHVNARISDAETGIHSVQQALSGLKDTTDLDYKMLVKQRAILADHIKTNETLRDDRLLGFTILSDIFLRLIKMIVAPLVFTSLVVGVAKVDNIKAVGRIGGKTLLWFLGATLVSLLLGMLLVNLFGPGKSVNLNTPYTGSATVQATAFSVKDFIEHIFPESFIAAMAGNQILQIVVFSLFFGIGTAAIGEKGHIIIKVFEAITRVLLKITGYVMYIAPLAVFGAMTAIIARQGVGILSTYAVFIGEFYFSLIVLWLLIIMAGYFILNKRAFTLIGKIKDAMLVAFGTSTSEAAYPKLFEELEQFGCSNKIVSFVLPLGYSFNLDGGMMYMTFASLFIAQAYGIHLSLVQQLTMLLVLMLTSKGIAGVPRAALVVVALILPQFNIPEAGFALIIGIDPVLDMGRSATNVLGNAIATAVVSKWEKEIN